MELESSGVGKSCRNDPMDGVVKRSGGIPTTKSHRPGYRECMCVASTERIAVDVWLRALGLLFEVWL